jgi:hypothetical protein
MLNIISKNISSLLLFILGGFLAIWFIPQIDKMLFPYSETPGIITFLGVGLIINFFMIVSLYFVMKNSLNIGSQFLLFTFLYNALVVIVKFSLAPYSLYIVNQNNPFVVYNFFAFINLIAKNGVMQPLPLFIMAATVFILYCIVFWFIYFLFRRKLKYELTAIDKNTTLSLNQIQNKILATVGLIVLVGVVIWVSGGALIIPLLFIISPMVDYISYVFSIWVSVSIAFSLIIAVYFVTKSFKTAKEQAILMKNAFILTSLFWIGVSFLLLYHALWVIYLFILTTLWPLKVTTPNLK